MGSQAEDEEGAGKEEDGGGGESGLHVEGGPEEADEEVGEEIADSVDRGQGTESHAMLILGHKFGGQRVFQSFFGADVETGEDKVYRQEPQGVGSGAKKDSGDACQGITGGENEFAAGNTIAQPPAEIGRTGVENVMQSVETYGETRGAGESVSGREHARGV